jgi:hypothetical protein
MRRTLDFLMRPAVSLWGTIGVFTLYILSYGPATWLAWNVSLPRWVAIPMTYVYWPIAWWVAGSEVVRPIASGYIRLWVDYTVGTPATRNPPLLHAPPFFLEVSGTLIGAWLIWNLVRWVNQAKTLKSNCPTLTTAP